MDMEPPVTPKPMPASATELPLDHTNKLFGIVYITLTGVIDTIVPTASLWLWMGKSMSYLIKLAPILWWALPTQSVTCQFPNASNPASQGWFPESLVQALAKLTTGRPEDWYKQLSAALLVFQTQVNRSTRKGPFELDPNWKYQVKYPLIQTLKL
ncbi:hypothetical protein DSO57_1018772 [Entomophthora muscae]|uniref:Uncharacterized protein n=1 Tax=Entomophthora muscae TaxID=34485 RepID=A0ACC2TR51_9FUNG|nr:hypothetical protein DSO57_1018772 [Entomophthora muscae]